MMGPVKKLGVIRSLMTGSPRGENPIDEMRYAQKTMPIKNDTKRVGWAIKKGATISFAALKKLGYFLRAKVPGVSLQFRKAGSSQGIKYIVGGRMKLSADAPIAVEEQEFQGLDKKMIVWAKDENGLEKIDKEIAGLERGYLPQLRNEFKSALEEEHAYLQRVRQGGEENPDEIKEIREKIQEAENKFINGYSLLIKIDQQRQGKKYMGMDFSVDYKMAMARARAIVKAGDDEFQKAGLRTIEAESKRLKKIRTDYETEMSKLQKEDYRTIVSGLAKLDDSDMVREQNDRMRLHGTHKLRRLTERVSGEKGRLPGDDYYIAQVLSERPELDNVIEVYREATRRKKEEWGQYKDEVEKVYKTIRNDEKEIFDVDKGIWSYFYLDSYKKELARLDQLESANNDDLILEITKPKYRKELGIDCVRKQKSSRNTFIKNVNEKYGANLSVSEVVDEKTSLDGEKPDIDFTDKKSIPESMVPEDEDKPLIVFEDARDEWSEHDPDNKKAK